MLEDGLLALEVHGRELFEQASEIDRQIEELEMGLQQPRASGPTVTAQDRLQGALQAIVGLAAEVCKEAGVQDEADKDLAHRQAEAVGGEHGRRARGGPKGQGGQEGGARGPQYWNCSASRPGGARLGDGFATSGSEGATGGEHGQEDPGGN